MKSKYTKYKKKDCIKCGEPCTRRMCRKCFLKNKYKGRISTMKSMGNRK